MRTLDFNLNIKSLSEQGEIVGFGSVFDVIDTYGERVLRGAFDVSLAKHRADGTRPAMLWQHDAFQPIGVWNDLSVTDRGLLAKGRLTLDAAGGREAYALLRDGAVTGLSIGYREVDVAVARDDPAIVDLKELDLREISLVTFPANRSARIQSVKTFNSARDIEDTLRAGGFSNRAAKAIAGDAWRRKVGAEDSLDDDEITQILNASAARIAAIGGK